MFSNSNNNINRFIDENLGESNSNNNNNQIEKYTDNIRVNSFNENDP